VEAVPHAPSLMVDRTPAVLEASLLATAAHFLGPSWAAATPATAKVDMITGGITNALYRVAVAGASPAAVLVRVFGDKTEVLIDRVLDNFTFGYLGSLGVGPWCYGVFGNGRVEAWLPARSLSPPEMGQLAPVDFVAAIARATARFHDIPFPADDRQPILWRQLTKWYGMASAAGFDAAASPAAATKAAQYARLRMHAIGEELAWMQTVLPSDANRHGADLPRPASTSRAAAAAVDFAASVVYAHNDLLSGNVLTPTTGEGSGSGEAAATTVRLIDYEYGAYNYRGFDIANHYCEHAGFDFDLDAWYPSREVQRHWVAAYLAATPTAAPLVADLHTDAAFAAEFWREVYRRVNAFALASHFWWGLWAVVQAQHSPIDFDFMAYSLLRMAAYGRHKAEFFPAADPVSLVLPS